MGDVKRKRVVLSIKSIKPKMQIEKYLDEGTSVKNVCDTYQVGSSTTFDLEKHKTDILKFYGDTDHPNLSTDRKTMHQGKNNEIDKVRME